MNKIIKTLYIMILKNKHKVSDIPLYWRPYRNPIGSSSFSNPVKVITVQEYFDEYIEQEQEQKRKYGFA